MPFPGPTEKQARLIWLALTGLAVATLIALLAALIWGLGRVLNILSPVLWPMAVAGIIACLLDPVVDFLVRRKIRRTRAIVCVFAFAVLFVAGMVGSIVPRAVEEGRQLAEKIPDYSSKMQTRAEDWLQHPPDFIRRYLKLANPASAPGETTTNQPPSGESVTNAPPATAGSEPQSFQGLVDPATLKQFVPKLGSWLFGGVSVVASVFGVLAGLALIPVYTFYFLAEKRGITGKWQDYLPVKDSRFKEELVFVLNAINNYLVAFFRGQVLVAICDSIMYTIGFTIIGLPYAIFMGVLALFLAIIPFIGSITICLLALIIALVNFGDWQHPSYVVVVFVVVQTLDGSFIGPKIMGDRTGLHPLAIIIALMVGTTLLGGLLGAVLGIPLAAALRVIMFRYIWKPRSG